MGFRRIPIGLDRLMPAQQALHGRALRSGAAAVNEPDHGQTGLSRGAQVLVHDRNHIAWKKGMKIDSVFNGNANWRFFVVHQEP